jgi:hypothetical protein
MLRVLKPGGTIAFSTWPPELCVGRLFGLIATYLPPSPPAFVPPFLWGEPNFVRERLGSAVKDLVFDRASMLVPALSPQHNRVFTERSGGPLVKVVDMLSATDPDRLAVLRRQLEALVADYFEDNMIHQDYLLTRATRH